MIGAKMKKVADAGTPTTQKDSESSYVQNLAKILASALLFAACCLVLVACSYVEPEPLKALVLEVVAVLLLAAREGVVRVDREWNRRMAAWRDLHSRELDGEPVGRYRQGDGVPRTAEGHEYEPLSWKGVQV